MSLDNKSMILAYGFNDKEKEFLNSLCHENSLNFKVIKSTMVNMTIKDIVEGLMIEVYDKDILEEKVILFNNIEDKDLEYIIPKIRSNRDLNCILAVVTPTSKHWTFKKLIKELIREREWYKKNSK